MYQLMKKRQICLGTNAEYFPEGTHMCLIYNDELQRREIIGNFITDGLRVNERVGYFAENVAQAQLWLTHFCHDEFTNNVEIAAALSVYCPHGYFDPVFMLDKLRTYYTEAHAQGFVGARVSGEMSWALAQIPGVERLIEYESRVNSVCLTHPITPICQYDARRFNGITLFNILKVHPMVIVQGQIVRNPYYIKPETFFTQQAHDV
jgi:hypothetical protein